MKTNEDAIFEEKVRVNTYECDFNGKWKPASFFQHMTEAAHLHATSLGAGYRELIRRAHLGTCAHEDQVSALSGY
jgi:acyl-CoA thioesterase FadM